MQIIALSSTEAEYIGLSEALREVIPLIWLLEQLKKMGLDLPNIKTVAKCQVFEDNAGAIKIAKNKKIQPRTKYLNVRWHWFWSCVQDDILEINAIRSEDNPADILTHPVGIERLAKHVETLMKWNLLPKASEGVLKYLSPLETDWVDKLPLKSEQPAQFDFWGF